MDMNIDGQFVARLRNQRGWSQEQLAEISNLGIRTVQRVEGQGQCSLESRNSLASAFDLTGEELSEGPDKAAAKRMIGTMQLAVICACAICTVLLWAKFVHLYHFENGLSEAEYRMGLVIAPLFSVPVILIWNRVARRMMQKEGIQSYPRTGLRLLTSIWKS